MRHSILKRAIQVKDLKLKSDGTYILLTLLSYRNEIFSDEIFFTIEESAGLNEQQLLNKAVVKFKQDERYITYLRILDNQKISEDTDGVKFNKLSIEYNSINDVSGLRYLEQAYPNPTREEFSDKKITRYFAKFLNQSNLFLELNFDDYNSLVVQNESVHYEAYDFFSFDWMINGTRDEILEFNVSMLDMYGELFPGFRSFHNRGEYKAGAYYITIYDEIKNLYTTGRELAYVDTLGNVVGYYHLGYLDGKLNVLLSEKNNFVGQNKILVEVDTFEEDVAVTETQPFIDDIKLSVKNMVGKMDNFLLTLNLELNKIGKSVRAELDNFGTEVDRNINNMIKDTDLEDIFNDSKSQFQSLSKAISSDSNSENSAGVAQQRAQSDIQQSYDSKIQSKLPKGTKAISPKIKIPSAPMPHGEGSDHAYDLGF